MKKIVFLLFLVLMMLFGCGNQKFQKIEKEKFVFGTYIKIIVYDADKKKAEMAIDAAFSELERVDKKLNTKTEGSIIDKINSSSTKTIEMDQESRDIFLRVEKMYEVSKGKYDITISPLMDIWGFTLEGSIEEIPSKKEIEKALSKIDYSKVEITEDKLVFRPPVEKIDTGSFLKGYAISKAKELMEDMGIKSAFITSVSSIETIGTKPEGKKWRIGLQDPSKPTEILNVVNLDGKAMGVSGDYQTFVEIDGKRYHHILDKETGYPVSDKKMVVVICEDAFTADMLSTAFFSMSIKEILEYAESNENIDVLVVDSSSKIITSEGFEDYFRK